MRVSGGRRIDQGAVSGGKRVEGVHACDWTTEVGKLHHQSLLKPCMVYNVPVPMDTSCNGKITGSKANSLQKGWSDHQHCSFTDEALA